MKNIYGLTSVKGDYNAEESVKFGGLVSFLSKLFALFPIGIHLYVYLSFIYSYLYSVVLEFVLGYSISIR